MKPEVHRAAVISECRKHRLWLSRAWGRQDPKLPFIMLNPSTADADVDDPTIRRCMAFARREGYHGIEVVNLFSVRATDPKEVWPLAPHRRNHPHAEHHLVDAALNGEPIVCAWGSVPPAAMPRVRDVVNTLSMLTNLVCLGTTKSGMPRHPLYVRGDQPLEPWTFPEK